MYIDKFVSMYMFYVHTASSRCMADYNAKHQCAMRPAS